MAYQRTANIDLQFPLDAGAELTLTVTGYDLSVLGTLVTLRIHATIGGALLATYNSDGPEITIVDATTVEILLPETAPYDDLGAGFYAYAIDVGDATDIDWRLQGSWQILRSEGRVRLDTAAANVTVDQITIEVTLAAAGGGAAALSVNDLSDVSAPVVADGMTLAWDEALDKWVPVRSRSALAIEAFPYQFSTSTDDTANAGRVQFNNADPTLATMMYVNALNASNEDVTLWLENIKSGAWLNIYDDNDSERFHAFDATGDAVANAGQFEIPITHYDSGGAPLMNNQQVAFFIRYVSAISEAIISSDQSIADMIVADTLPGDAASHPTTIYIVTGVGIYLGDTLIVTSA